MDISSILFIVGGVLAAVTLVQTRGASLLSWGVLAIAVGLLLPLIA